MPGIVNYRLPTSFMAAIEVTVAGFSPLVGALTSISLEADGTHSVFPHATTSGTAFDTYSVVRSSPGSFGFAGLLLADDSAMQGLLALFGTYNDSVSTQVTIVNPATLATLASWQLEDFRLSSVGLRMHLMANYTMVMGDFRATYRSKYNTPEPD